MSTQVIYKVDKVNNFRYISIEGHASYKEKGADVVCAGISAITNGAINFLQTYYKDTCQISLQPALIVIHPIENNPNCQLCLKMMFYQLQNIANSYPDYLKISKED